MVTGASRGLGAGMAARFADRGLGLGLCARTEPDAPDAAGAGPPALTAAVDVTDAAAVDRFAAAVVERFGRIDLWINNAGLLDPIGPLRDADPAEVGRNVEVNVTGVLLGSAAFARHVRTRPGGGRARQHLERSGDQAVRGLGAVLRVQGRGRPCHPGRGGRGGRRRAAGLRGGARRRRHRHAGGDPGRTGRPVPAAWSGSVQMQRDDAFNSPAWVADHVLDLAFGDAATDDVVVRVPDEPRRG